MTPNRPLRRAALMAALLLPASALPAQISATAPASAAVPAGYAELTALFADWRAFERAPDRNGAPDYTEARMRAAHESWQGFRDRLEAIDTTDWPVPLQVDWHVVLAELNGFDFNCRVLKPWARDPAFYKSLWTYQSDVPAHEGPTHHALIEQWTYEFPLNDAAQTKLAAELRTVPPLLAQARDNLKDSTAGDLWRGGIRTMRIQMAELDDLTRKVDRTASDELRTALDAAREATAAFADWLDKESSSRTGPSGVGREQYTWYLQNVHLVPLSWEDEVRLLERELARSWSSLRLEEHRNRELPEMVAVRSKAEYAAQADASATRLMRFLDEQQVLRVTPNMEPALREHLGRFVPAAVRNFFWIGAHYDPTPLYTHFYHWWDLARMRDTPHESPIRRVPLLYNIFDSRAEGTATGVEEMFLHAGLYDGEHRRSREIVWILLAQRAARGLGSLRAHSGEMTMAEAGTVHVAWTPRGWMKTEPHLLQFEQHLYLRQPGYGTSYITGKYLLEQLLADYAQQLEARGEEFSLKTFFTDLNSCGMIPLSLIRWQLTGLDDQVPTRRAR